MAYGLYIHIPFCVKKCEYCDFLSFPCGDIPVPEGGTAACMGEAGICENNAAVECVNVAGICENNTAAE